jgi:hypothetical protein
VNSSPHCRATGRRDWRRMRGRMMYATAPANSAKRATITMHAASVGIWRSTDVSMIQSFRVSCRERLLRRCRIVCGRLRGEPALAGRFDVPAAAGPRRVAGSGARLRRRLGCRQRRRLSRQNVWYEAGTGALGEVSEPLFFESELADFLAQQVDPSQIAHVVTSSMSSHHSVTMLQNGAAECDPGHLARRRVARRQESVQSEQLRHRCRSPAPRAPQAEQQRAD